MYFFIFRMKNCWAYLENFGMEKGRGERIFERVFLNIGYHIVEV